MVNLFLFQSRDILDVLSIESVSMIGVLLLVIFGLIYHVKSIEKRFSKERKELKEEVKSAREKLEKEYNAGNAEMKSVIEKYYVLSTRVLDHLKKIL